MEKDVPMMDLALVSHQINYWVKQFLAGMIIVSTILLINNPSILIQKLWIGLSVPFILLHIAGLSGQLSIWRNIFTLNKNEELDLDDNLLHLAQDMGSSISTYFLGKDLSTAFLVGGRKLIIGENVGKMLSENEVLAILAHEFSHDTRKGLHNKAHIFGFGVTLIPVLYFALSVPRLMGLVVMIACFYLLMSIFFWYVECDCDANAVKFVPINDFASALTKVYKDKFNAFSFTHPSPNYRINRLKTSARGE